MDANRVIGAHYPPILAPLNNNGKIKKKMTENKTMESIISPLNSGSAERTRSMSDPITVNTSDAAIKISRLKKFQKILDQENVDLDALRKLSWQGIPPEVRSMTWKLLLELLPTNKDRREATLERKRKEYCDCVPKYFDVDDSARTSAERTLFKQIQIDVPRTNPTFVLFQSPAIQQCLARVLYIWAIRHPASGYVQGINDLATPFIIVFLGDYLGHGHVEDCDPSNVPKSVLTTIEADTYWCMTKLLDGIQDCYTFAQPGIQRMIHKLSELIHRIDGPLHEHLERYDIHFIQFSFRWMNCLLMREVPLQLLIRIWDTYFAELENLAVFHIYVCAAFLVRFSEELRQLDYQDCMLFLKNPPTATWQAKDMEVILSQGYMWQKLFEDSPKHLED